MPSLYQVSHETRMAIDELMQLDDMPENVIEDTLESVSGDLHEKQLSVAAYVMNLRGDVVAMKEYEKSMNERRKSIEKKILRLTESIMTSMQVNNQREIPSLELSIKIRMNPASVVIDDDKILPKKYFRVIKEPNKSSIKEAILSGINVKGVHLQRKEKLEIK